MAGFHWKQGKQFLLTKLINYAKLLEQQTQQSSHVEHKGQKSGGDCISVMHPKHMMKRSPILLANMKALSSETLLTCETCFT